MKLDLIEKIFQQIPFKEVLIPTVILLSGFLTFAPDEWTQKLGLDKFLSTYKGPVGLTFLSAAILFIVLLVNDKRKKIKKKRAAKKRVTSILESLDTEEKAILREFYLQELNAIWTGAPDNILASLLHKGVVERIDPYKNTSTQPVGIFIELPSEVKDLISLSIVDLPTGELTPEQIKEIKESRPRFIREDRGKFPRHFD